MKKKISVVLAAALCAGSLVVGAAAASGIQMVKAELRTDYTIELNGKTATLRDAGGSRVYPLSYNGSTYLPVRAIGELTGLEVDWDGATKTVSLSEPGTQTTKPAASAVAGEIEDLLDEIEADLAAAKKTSVTTYAQAKAVERTLDALDDRCGDLEDRVEWEYRAGNLTADEARTLKAACDAVERQIEQYDEALDRQFDWDD